MEPVAREKNPFRVTSQHENLLIFVAGEFYHIVWKNYTLLKYSYIKAVDMKNILMQYYFEWKSINIID